MSIVYTEESYKVLQAEVERLKDEIKALNTQIDVEVCSNTVQSQRAENAEAKLSRYEKGIELEATAYYYETIRSSLSIEGDKNLPYKFNGQRVRVLVMPIDNKGDN